MRNNPTMLAHPTIQRKIKIAALKAWFASRKPDGSGFHKEYVANRKGNNIIRIEFSLAYGFRAYGDMSRNITAMVEPIIGYKINKDFL